MKLIDRIPHEIEALHNEELPKDCNGAEICAYLSMRAIYQGYNRGYLEKDKAIREKKRVLQKYQNDIESDEIILSIASLRKRIEEPARNYAKHPTLKNADLFYAAVYGLPPDWRKEAIQYEE